MAENNYYLSGATYFVFGFNEYGEETIWFEGDWVEPDSVVLGWQFYNE